MNEITVLIVPGLRDAVALHWQTLLEAKLRAQGRPVGALTPPGREGLQCAACVSLAVVNPSHVPTPRPR